MGVAEISKVYIASGNPSKAREFMRILESVFPFFKSNITVRGAKSAEETGNSYAENAKIKSLALHSELLKEGSSKHIIFSDDSGLEVRGLNNEPGLYSARYAGKHGLESGFRPHIDKVLVQLLAFPENDPARRAQMKCAIHALCFSNNQTHEYSVEGVVDGRIVASLGETHGFGYDPIFYHEPSEKTFGQLSDQEKDKISHRWNACQKLAKYKQEFQQFAPSK